MHAMRASTEIHPMPEKKVASMPWGNNDRLYYADDLEASLREGYAENRLPGEMGNYNWARTGEKIL